MIYDSNGDPLKILSFPADNAGCGFYRVRQPIRAVKRELGITVTEGMLPAHGEQPPNVVFLQRAINPKMTELIEQLHSLRDDGRLPRLVMDLDDDIFSIEKENSAYDFYSQPWVTGNLIKNLLLMDMVTVSTDQLAAVVADLGVSKDRIRVIQNAVPDRLVNLSTANPVGSMTPSRGLNLCWSGSATHSADFGMIAGDLSDFLEGSEHSLTFVGADYTSLLSREAQKRCSYRGWANGPVLSHNLLASLDIDVWLAPLAPSTFNSSKSALRLMEGAALRLPGIATDFGPYSSTNGSPGALYVPPGASWAGALQSMTDPKVREQLSIDGHSWVSAEHTMTARLPEYLSLFEDLLT